MVLASTRLIILVHIARTKRTSLARQREWPPDCMSLRGAAGAGAGRALWNIAWYLAFAPLPKRVFYQILLQRWGTIERSARFHDRAIAQARHIVRRTPHAAPRWLGSKKLFWYIDYETVKNTDSWNKRKIVDYNSLAKIETLRSMQGFGFIRLLPYVNANATIYILVQPPPMPVYLLTIMRTSARPRRAHRNRHLPPAPALQHGVAARNHF